VVFALASAPLERASYTGSALELLQHGSIDFSREMQALRGLIGESVARVVQKRP
jgi:hypothetical protein